MRLSSFFSLTCLYSVYPEMIQFSHISVFSLLQKNLSDGVYQEGNWIALGINSKINTNQKRKTRILMIHATTQVWSSI